MFLHWPRLELGSPAWQASILPLDHQCYHFFSIGFPSVFFFFLT